MKNIKIGGVPEHFNLPWYITLKDKIYQKHGINLRWQDFPGGTGEMNEALRKKEIDIAVILTEGIVRDIINGNESKIVQEYVQTPLIWGIHVAANSDYQKIDDLKGTKAAISRYGSGSHLMAIVNAENKDWDLETDMDYEVIKNLDGALENLPKGNGDYFMWEKFMTKPFVDDGTFRRIGEAPTPWPCFVIAARNEVLENNEAEIKTILDIINHATLEFKELPNIDEMISTRYGQKLEDVRQWLNITKWSQSQIKKSDLTKVQKYLLRLDLIESKVQNNSLLHNF